jgi:hypothetical protein
MGGFLQITVLCVKRNPLVAEEVHPRTGQLGEWSYSCTLSFNLGGRWGEGWSGRQHHAPAALSAGKTRYLLYNRLGGPQSRFGRVR